MKNLKRLSFVEVLFVAVLFTSCGLQNQKKEVEICPICKKEVTEQTVVVGATLVETGERIVVCQPCYAVGKQFGKVW